MARAKAPSRKGAARTRQGERQASPEASYRSAPAARRPTDLRQVLISEALALIEQQDVAAISLREVARRAKVSPGAPYHHFTDRIELLAAVAEQGFGKLDERMSQALTGVWDAAPIERLIALCSAYLSFAIEHRAHYRVMFLPEMARAKELVPLQQAALSSLMRLVDVVHALQPGAPRDHAMRAAIAAWSTAHGFTMLFHDGLISGIPGEIGRAHV